MPMSRRSFLGAVPATGLAGAALALGTTREAILRPADLGRPGPGVLRAPEGFDPWLELDPATLLRNAAEVGRLAGGRPVMAVVKNHGYGLGTAAVARVLENAPEIDGFAVVKAEEAVELLDAGVGKPILLMGRAGPGEEVELVRRGVRLAPFEPDAPGRLTELARRNRGPVPVHLYLDTGMGRLGVAYHRALPWARELVGTGAVAVEGTFMGFTETDELDPEQLARFRALAEEARSAGPELGRLHAASSHGLFHRREALLDMVRPGLALFGAYPSGAEETRLGELRPAHRLRARVVRVERLRPGDSVSYGRNYVAEREVWTATLPVGHADGYPRRAVDGCEVLIRGRTFPVIGAVSASHTIVEVGPEPVVEVGDPATLVGGDDPAIHPNEVARRAGISVYDVLMHLNPKLPVVRGFTG